MTDQDVRRAIARKRDGESLPAATWKSLIAAYMAGAVDDAQMSALLMASVIRELSFDETLALTEAFIASGEAVAAENPRAVDKHSSGGVGDTASLIVVPLVAACGVPVGKISGRALAHTGGTLDKLEAVPGVRTDLDPRRFAACVREAGCAIAAQGAEFVPADKRIYALRDRTATVPSRGLIGASIVSKKIAGGAAAIVYDVKLGSGAFVRDLEEARALARTLVALTAALGRGARALVTDMEEPLGRSIGTGLEALEARDFLRGTRRDERLAGVCEAVGAAMLAGAGFSGDGRAELRAALRSGRAYETYDRMLAAQGALPGALGALEPHASRTPASSARGGCVARIDTAALGYYARDLVARCGALAGIVVEKRTGDAVRQGEALAVVYGDPALASAVAAAFELDDDVPVRRPLVYDETGSGVGLAAAATVTATAGTPRSIAEMK